MNKMDINSLVFFIALYTIQMSQSCFFIVRINHLLLIAGIYSFIKPVEPLDLHWPMKFSSLQHLVSFVCMSK